MEAKARYISNDKWQGLEQNRIYTVDLNYYICNGSISWFVFKSNAPFFHIKQIYRNGYPVNDHMKYFEILEVIK
jgi:hypothetical protein